MTDDIHEERRAFRAQRVRFAVWTSAGSKALGLIVQFLAIPLAVRSLGPERFGIYTMLVSALVWIDLGRLGVGPGLTRELAVAWNRNERERERVLFSNAMFFLLTVAALLVMLLAGGYPLAISHLGLIFGESTAQFRPEILAGMAIIATLLVTQVVFSAGEAARSAYQDDFINNLINTVANLGSLLLIFWVALFIPTVWSFALAVFGPMALAKGVNLALLLFRSRPYLLPRWRDLQRPVLHSLLGSSLAFWLVQIATLMMHNLSLVQLGQMIGAKEVTPFAVVFRLIQLLSTGVLMISMPLWPAITDAVVRGDRIWIRQAYRRLIMSALGFCVLVALALAALGTVLIPVWAGDDVRPGLALNAALGAYFVIWMWNHCHSTVLFGLGRLWTVAGVTLVEGTLVLVLAWLLVPHYGALGTAIALCTAGMVITGWVLPLVVRSTLSGHPDEVPSKTSGPYT